MAVKPLKPDEAVALKETQFPDEVIEAFNEMIAQRLKRGCAEFQLKEVKKLIIDKFVASGSLGTKKRSTISSRICEQEWLDVEDIYRKEGWKVVYDSPGWDEHYEPFFRFKKKAEDD
jgi:hypothetical protein